MADTSFWSAAALAERVQGRWLGDTPVGPVAGVSIDTRTMRPGEAYVAIAGENHDGHAYVDAALDAGASFAVIDNAEWAEKRKPLNRVLLVPDAVATLQAWASSYREVLAQAACRVIAVVGSNGKTTTRHLLHHVLTRCGKAGTQSPKSFNNHLGVPLTLLAARPEHDFVACEIGTNHPGEIDALARIARPDAAAITCIGQEHLEFFGDLDGVAREEAALLPHVRPGGVVFVEADAAERIAPYYDVQENVVMLPVHADRYADHIPEDFPFPGDHHRRNAALVAAVTRWITGSDDGILDALRCAGGVEGRMQALRYADGVAVIHDAYNANPDSTRLALQHLAGIDVPQASKAAVLGDMLELGSHAPAAHSEALRHARGVVGPDRLWCVGDLFEGAEPYSDGLAQRVVGSLKAGDVLLLKGSRGLRLERILPHLESRFGPPT